MPASALPCFLVLICFSFSSTGSRIRRQTNFVECSEGEFRCTVRGNGGDLFGCISRYQVCDGIKQCSDGTDEKSCAQIGESCVVPSLAEGTSYSRPSCSSRPEVCKLSGTVVQVSCGPGYVVTNSLNDTTLLQCPNEKWNQRRTQCLKCGQPAEVAVKKIGTLVSSPKKHPWHVAVYKKQDGGLTNVCGGTIVTPNVVLTAANCIFNTNGETVNASLYMVAAGRSLRDIASPDPNTQRKQVEKVQLSWSFNAEITSYEQNVALLKLSGSFMMNSHVQPACFYPAKKNRHRDFPRDPIVMVAGWGLRNKGISRALGESHFKILDLKSCRKLAPSIIHVRFFSYDKFCLLVDKEKNGLQQTDSGSGVIVAIDGINYVYGVVSVKIPEHLTFSIVTNVTKHENWIRKSIESFDDEDKCPEASFRCTYGGCISLDLICNQNEDCEDGSDENKEMCAKIDQKVPGRNICVLPNFSKGSTFRLESCKSDSCALLPGTVLANGDVVKVACAPGYGLPGGSASSLCFSRTYFPPLEQCVRMCDPLVSETMDIECWFKGARVSCDAHVFPGATAKYDCRQEHEPVDPTNFRGDNLCLEGGLWRQGLPQCKAVCGLVSGRKTAVSLVSFGQPVREGNYPWHVGLYQRKTLADNDYEQSCGGTLIKSQIVLTAAHCLVFDNGRVDPRMLKIAGGKYFRSYNADEKNLQLRNVKSMVIGEFYTGSATSFTHDIALLLLDQSFSLNAFVLPACIDWTARHPPRPGQIGTVVGWGLTEKEEYSTQLLEANMPYVDLKTCTDRLRKDHSGFTRYLTLDKFCVDYPNGTGAQKGDSGGGFTMPVEGKHYIYGVVSLKPVKENTFAAFTNVLNFTDWMRDNVDQMLAQENELKRRIVRTN